MVRKGAADSVRRWVEELGGSVPEAMETIANGIAAEGGTPLVVADVRERQSRASWA